MLIHPTINTTHARGTASRTPFTAIAGVYHAAANSSRTLWGVQGVLAVVFLFAGVSKLVMSAESLTENSDFSAEFFRFIGVCEALGACGLVLPGAFGIRREVTPLAAAGLFVIMVGAVVVTVADMGVAAAAMPFVVGVACAFVAAARSSELRNQARRSEARASAS